MRNTGGTGTSEANPPGRLQGKVALISGAGRGQGRSHALHLARKGADVIALDICEPIPSISYPMAFSADLDETAALVEKEGRRVVALGPTCGTTRHCRPRSTPG